MKRVLTCAAALALTVSGGMAVRAETPIIGHGGGGYPGHSYSGIYASDYGHRSVPYRGSVVFPGAIMSQPVAVRTVVTPIHPATIDVTLPTADAKVVLGHTTMSSTGSHRTYVSPSLEPGVRYSYEITATWTQNGQPMTETRTIVVNPDHVSVVDFTHPDHEVSTIK
jgi:uncharacterized protein (TIGR03000 family)